jgi:hypothetical protein
MRRSTRCVCRGIGLILCILMTGPDARASGATMFSSLPAAQQNRLRAMVEPPPLEQRSGCYSTPMYYLMYAGYQYDGANDKNPETRTYLKGKPGPDWGHWELDRNRPDWQEAMVRDWAEIGLNNTHLDIYPLDDKLSLPADYVKALTDYADLSAKYGLKVGVRIDTLGSATGAWEVNPNNPHNQIDAYLDWVGKVVQLFKGKTVYYVLDDEWTLHKPAPNLSPRDWTPQSYLSFFKRASAAIKAADPQAKVSMFAASSGEWFNVLYLLQNGYAHYGDAVAINHYDYNEVKKFFSDADKLAPGLMFLSNGVGYCSSSVATERYPEGDPYEPLPNDQVQGNAIARTMFSWWDLGAATAPYYISLRNWVVDGKVYPRWFGFFGFEDYVIDHDQLSVKRYPSWYAYQTIAHTFYNRSDFKPPSFSITTSRKVSMFRAYEHAVQGGSELVLMLWDKLEAPVQVRIDNSSYQYPVHVSMSDYHHWSDLPSEVSANTTILDLNPSTEEPMIIRLFGEQ